MPLVHNLWASRMREICTSGLMRGEAASYAPLLLDRFSWPIGPCLITKCRKCESPKRAGRKCLTGRPIECLKGRPIRISAFRSRSGYLRSEADREIGVLSKRLVCGERPPRRSEARNADLPIGQAAERQSPDWLPHPENATEGVRYRPFPPKIDVAFLT